MKVSNLFKRNPCKKCDYYHSENNTCQSKKCCTGGTGRVTFLDRLLCEPYNRKEQEHVNADKS